MGESDSDADKTLHDEIREYELRGMNDPIGMGKSLGAQLAEDERTTMIIDGARYKIVPRSDWLSMPPLGEIDGRHDFEGDFALCIFDQTEEQSLALREILMQYQKSDGTWSTEKGHSGSWWPSAENKQASCYWIGPVIGYADEWRALVPVAWDYHLWQ